jgi:hypothetical protein
MIFPPRRKVAKFGDLFFLTFAPWRLCGRHSEIRLRLYARSFNIFYVRRLRPVAIAVAGTHSGVIAEAFPLPGKSCTIPAVSSNELSG